MTTDNNLIHKAKSELFEVQESYKRFRRVKGKADNALFLSAAVEIVMCITDVGTIPLAVGAGFVGFSALLNFAATEQLRAHESAANALRGIIDRGGNTPKPA
jgi:hypothetical protein